MKKIAPYLLFFFLVSFLTWALINEKRSNVQKKELTKLKEEIRYTKRANQYYQDLLKFKIKYSNFPLGKTKINTYDITEDTSKSRPINIHNLLMKNPRSLILRYTEIGCNECTSLTIGKLNTLHQSHPDLPIYILVDFTNYDSYLQWRKVSEVDFPVYYLKKGDIDFDKGCEGHSYLFLVDNQETAHSFFIPNSGMPDILNYYLSDIYDLNE